MERERGSVCVCEGERNGSGEVRYVMKSVMCDLWSIYCVWRNVCDVVYIERVGAVVWTLRPTTDTAQLHSSTILRSHLPQSNGKAE